LVVLFLPTGVLGLTDLVSRLRRAPQTRKAGEQSSSIPSFIQQDQESGDK
jgi:hypothetical protein